MSQLKCNECRRFISASGGKCSSCGYLIPPASGENYNKNGKGTGKINRAPNGNAKDDQRNASTFDSLTLEERVTELSTKLDKVIQLLDDLRAENRKLISENDEL